MLKKLTLLALLTLLLMSLLSTTAQDESTCDSDSLAQIVEESYTSYTRDARGDNDFEESLDSLDVLYQSLDTLYADCDEARYQDYVEEGTTLLNDLREGGYIIYVRHTETDRSQIDSGYDSCETQRNLSEQGRVEATEIGEAWSTLNIPISMLISTRLCRTRETAELAFGEPDVIVNRDEFEAIELAIMLTAIPEDGTNTIIVGHIGSLQRVTGISIPHDSRFDEGDALVYRPTGDDYELVARIGIRNWFDLARIVSEME